ncbi:MAG: dienelactone hydrolase family protein [Polyangiaceae bacterium]
MSTNQVSVPTPAGAMSTFVARPGSGAGPWPLVVLYMDGLGMRPALVRIGERIAAFGFVVAMPDLFYRTGPYEPADPQGLLHRSRDAEGVVQKHLGKVNVADVTVDTEALLAAMDRDPSVKVGKIGTTGYCLGGRLSFAMATKFPSRVAAAASFHGGGLVTDAPETRTARQARLRARLRGGGGPRSVVHRRHEGDAHRRADRSPRGSSRRDLRGLAPRLGTG